MELILESKLAEDLGSKLFVYEKYYSIYSLKMNRLNKKNEIQKAASNTSVAQFLNQELTANKDFSLNVVLTNVPVKNEFILRETLANKIQKGTFYASSSKSGSIACMNLGFKETDQEIRSMCYYNLLRPSENEKNGNDNEYILCFIMADEKNNLDLFRTNLDLYCNEILYNHFNKFQEANFFKELEKILSDWFQYSIAYVDRILELLSVSLVSVLFEEAFTCGSIEMSNDLEPKLKHDLRLLFKSVDCSPLILSSTLSDNDTKETKYIFDENQKEKEKKSKLFIGYEINANEKKIHFSKTEASDFSVTCAKTLMKSFKSDLNPFQTKQIIENYKLKLIQDLNTFNRFLRKATNHYYDLYKVYLYLKHSKISRTLLKMFENCVNEDTILMKTFCVVKEFYIEKQIKIEAI